MEKYKTGSCLYASSVSATISPLAILRETEKTVTVDYNGKERRINKVSDYDVIHDTWEAAHEFLIKKGEHHVERLRMELESAKSQLVNIRGMKNPS
ncbi:MAG: hypothetical protein A2Y38_25295 [Spirochaetes bacterium GWB1_59_5]|nr:MAG: hypothetical protein A2Y38_25295 [Spirochaetes bacterium GWB1_59_5]